MKLDSKKDFEKLMYKFLEPLKFKYSKDKGRVKINGSGCTYSDDVIEYEAFSRPLWALVPFFAGGGCDKEFENNYLMGFASGVNPNSEDYWGGFIHKDQRFVEMAAIATALIFSSEKLFNPLNYEEKENLSNWLYEINNYILPENNWLFFRVLVNIGLKKNNRQYSKEKLEEDLEVIESYYLGDGWYKDGISEHRDYYIAFAMHYYGLLYAKAMEKEDPSRCKIFKDRAKLFAKDYIYFFSNSGEAIPYGRSLTYRFAQCSFFCATVFAGVEVFDIGVIKGIITRHLKYWLGNEIFDSGGLLNIGYNYQNLIMSERYNAPGSPYWSMKIFLLLALPDNHIFWKSKSKELPELNLSKTLNYANMIIQRTDYGKNVNAYLPAELELYGHGHIIEKYSKFVYSTAFGFSVMRSAFCLEEASPDSMLAFVIDDTVFVRKVSKDYKIFENTIISFWSPFKGISVTTTIYLTKEGHIRKHYINSEYNCEAYDCGFSLSRFSNDYNEVLNDNSILIKSDKKYCKVIDLNKTGRPHLIECFPNTNVIYKNTMLPTIKHKINKGESIITSEIITGFNLS